MKKFILAIAILSSTALYSFANFPDPGYKVLEEFKKEFPNAENVSWTEEAEFAKVTFVLGGKRILAYFSQEGILEGTIRDLFYDQLPLNVVTALEKKFKGSEVLYIREINNAEGTHYRIRLDVEQRKLIVKVGSDGNISEVDKVK